MAAEALQVQDTTWSGPAASWMYTRAVIGAETIDKGGVFVIDDIRKTITIPKVEISNFIQRRAATPVSQGTATVTGATLTPRDLMLYYEVNPRDFESHFYAEQLKPRLLDRTLPVTFESVIVAQTMRRLNEYFENAIWRSRIAYDPLGAAVSPSSKGDVGGTINASNLFYFDGLLNKAIQDPNTILVGSPVTLTSTNIRSQMQAALNLVPAALLYRYGSGGLKYYMPYSAQKLYEQALREDTFKNQDTTAEGINKYSGYDILPCPGMPDNTFIIAIGRPDNASNLWVGINSQEDNQLKLSQLQNNSELYFVKGLFKMDTQIGYTDQIVLYTVLTA